MGRSGNRPTIRQFAVISATLLSGALVATATVTAREWSDAFALSTFEAELIDYNEQEQTVTLRGENGQEATIPLAGLSRTDQEYVQSQAASRSTGGRGIELVPSEGAPARRLALLIGVNDYTDLRKLRYAVADMKALREKLIAAGFESEDIILLTCDADSNAYRPFQRIIEKQLDPNENGSFMSRIREGDLALIAMSGHGVEGNGTPYYCPIDAEKDDPAGTMISIAAIYRKLNASDAQYKLVLVDACRDPLSTSATRSANETQRGFDGFSKSLSESAQSLGIMMMQSCDSGQKSYEDSKLGHGVFMYHLLQGLAGEADRAAEGNRDGTISLLELYDYAAEETQIYARQMAGGGLQTPKLKGDFTNFDFTDSIFEDLSAKLIVRVGGDDGPLAKAVPVAIVRRDAFDQREERLAEGLTGADGSLELRVPRASIQATDRLLAKACFMGQIADLPVDDLLKAPNRTLVVNYPQEFTNSVGMRFKLIPAGEFMMGNPDYEQAQYTEKPHRVRLTKPYYLGQHEVTLGDFEKFQKETGYKTEAEEEGWTLAVTPELFKQMERQREGAVEDFCEKKLKEITGHDIDSWFRDNLSDSTCGAYIVDLTAIFVARGNLRSPGVPQKSNHPVTCVSWNDAVAFCNWLSEKEGRVYRLPTEAEWEYACRAGATTHYQYGDDEDALAKHANVKDAAYVQPFGADWPDEAETPGWAKVSDGHAFTAPRGSFEPNAFGLYDMYGNVREWCQDWYEGDYYNDSPIADPRGPTDGKYKVTRGGCWSVGPLVAQASNREYVHPRLRANYLGFRVVLVPPE